ncbi:hypothetical protein SAMN05216200_10673 [Oceanicella actignis]|uniref:Uncharacterized protein n=1 Tax=Oceanicella actignis TaxID=1189325 RepID=A0A1M7TFJ0_9RHOB|nr:hypothetical protein SAMN05216200_10673 [Oceanicella actignis]
MTDPRDRLPQRARLLLAFHAFNLAAALALIAFALR